MSNSQHEILICDREFDSLIAGGEVVLTQETGCKVHIKLDSISLGRIGALVDRQIKKNIEKRERIDELLGDYHDY